MKSKPAFLGMTALMCLAMAGTSLAQTTAVPSTPNCAINDGSSSIVCTANLDGNGKQQLIVGSYQQTQGYIIILNNNGTVRKQICWKSSSSGPCPTIYSPGG